MRKWFVFVLLLGFASVGFAEIGFEGRPITNNLMMPTGYTLNSGELIIGIGPIGFGITNNIQMGTNLLLWFLQDYNFNLKISLIKSKRLALAAGLALDYWNLNALEEDDEEEDAEDLAFTFISPFIVLSTSLSAKTAVHVGGQYSYISGEADIDDAEVISNLSGTRLYTGLEHSVSNKTKFLLEGGYDLDFKGFLVGGGILMGWDKFRLKLGVTYYAPEKASTGFTLPNIGLWWRFKA